MVDRRESFGELKSGETRRQDFERDPGLQSSQRGTDAVVDAPTERQIRSDPSALERERRGVAVVALVAIGREIDQEEFLTGLHRLAE